MELSLIATSPISSTATGAYYTVNFRKILQVFEFIRYFARGELESGSKHLPVTSAKVAVIAASKRMKEHRNFMMGCKDDN